MRTRERTRERDTARERSLAKFRAATQPPRRRTCSQLMSQTPLNLSFPCLLTLPSTQRKVWGRTRKRENKLNCLEIQGKQLLCRVDLNKGCRLFPHPVALAENAKLAPNKLTPWKVYKTRSRKICPSSGKKHDSAGHLTHSLNDEAYQSLVLAPQKLDRSPEDYLTLCLLD